MKRQITNKAVRRIEKPKEVGTTTATNFLDLEEEVSFEECSNENGYKNVRVKTRKNIDPAEVYRLAQLDCSPAEIAYGLHVDYSTLVRHYSEVIDAGRNNLRIVARQKISQKVRAGDPQALFKYAEKELGYNSKLTVEQTNKQVSDDELIDKLAQLDPQKIVAILMATEQSKKDDDNTFAVH